MDCDVRTGVINYYIYNYIYSEPIMTISCQMGGDMPVASQQMTAGTNYVGSAMELAQSTAMLATGAVNPISLGMTLKGVADAVTAFNDTNAIVDGNYTGGYGEFANNDYIVVVRNHSVREEPSNLANLYGRPCHKVLTINTLNGYVETRGFSIDISAPKTIKDMINEFMDKGVYLE